MSKEPAPLTSWFHEARFGLFIHWGLYALRSSVGAEWAIYRESIPKEAYRKYLDRFTADRFDPDAWMSLAKRAGMRYVVITAKHHDGFCLFPTDTTDWHIGNTPFGRDAIRLLAEAARRAGLKFGIYFSIWDMWQPGLDGGLNAIGAEGELEAKADKAAWRPSPEGISVMHRQVEELMTGYGPIDMLWFDVRRAPGQQYDADRLMRRVRELQPGILINDRLVDDSCSEKADIITPENRIPARGIRDESGALLKWESCMCYNQHWGYVRDDDSFKSPQQVLRELVEITSKGGNLLLNAGPNPRGEFPQPWYDELAAHTGAWLERNGQSIYGSQPADLTVGGTPDWPGYQFFTDNFRWRCFYTQGQNPNQVYLHITRYPQDLRVVLPEFDRGQPESAWLLEDGTEIPIEPGNYLSLHPGESTLRLPRIPSASGVTTLALHFPASAPLKSKTR